MSEHPLHSVVRKFYNKLNKELFVEKCRLNDNNLTPEQTAIFSQLSETIKERYYGSGMNIPEKLEGKRILDIGCGSGSLVFVLSKLVGPTGYVIGVDITDGLIETARSQSDFHVKQWGYDKPNFEFRMGNAEKMDQIEGLTSGSFDIVVSNGVFCLTLDKVCAFRHAYNLLKEGGQFYLNDVFADKKPPEEHKENEYLFPHGLTGCLLWEDLATIARAVVFTTPYLTCAAPLDIDNEEYIKMLDNTHYTCAGLRLFRLTPGVKRGPSRVTYNGNISTYPQSFPWDIDITFQKGVGKEVDGDLSTVLAASYFSDSFTFEPASVSPETNRNQNPFAYMDKLKNEGKLPEPIYTLK